MRRRTFLGGASAAALTAITTTGAAASVTGPADGGELPSAPSDCSDYTECEPCLDDSNCGLRDCDACV